MHNVNERNIAAIKAGIAIFLKDHQRLSIKYLPASQSGLNFQERIWRRVCHKSTTNNWYSALDQTGLAASKRAHFLTPANIERA